MTSNKVRGKFSFDQATVMSSQSIDFFCEEKQLRELREKALPELTDLTKEMRKNGLLRFEDYLPFDYLLKAAGRDNKGEFTHVTVDLTATDGQILKDFSNWLKAYRKTMEYMPDKSLRGEKTATKNPTFGERNLKNWVEWKLLPYIDLELAKLAGENIDNNKIAELLYPDECSHKNENIDTDNNDTTMKKLRERITGTLKPKAEALLSDSLIDAINLQLERIG
jgi:hypothetical protein